MDRIGEVDATPAVPGPEERPPYGSRRIFKVVEVLFLLSVAFGCLLTLRGLFLAVPAPYQREDVEGPLMAAGARVAQGLPLYPPATEMPYVMNSYGPIPYYFIALCIKFFGRSFTAPRILVVIAGIWCAAIMALLMRHWGAPAYVCVAFGLLYLTRPVVADWLPILRVDLLGIAFSITGVYVFARYRRWYLSIPFFVAGLFCKAILIAAPVACLTYLLLRQRTRNACSFGAGLLALGAVFFFWAQRITSGWFAFQTIWVSAGHPFNLRFAYHALRGEAIADYLLVVLALSLAYYTRSRRDLWLPLLYLGTASLSLVAIGKIGAASNYFLEWEAVLVLCTGLAYGLLRSQVEASFAAALLPGILAAFVFVNTHISNPVEGFVGCRDAYEFVRQNPAQRILIDNVGALTLAGKPPLVYDPFLWTREVVQRGWSDSKIVELVRSRQVDLVILDSDPETQMKDQERWPRSVMEAVEGNYRLVRTFDCDNAHLVYGPK